jgi:histone H3/H4
MANLPKSAVARIAKSAGAKRIGGDAVEALVAKAEEYVTTLVKNGVKLAEHAGRTTVKASDIELAATPA